MSKTSVPKNAPQAYWVRIQYSPDEDHYMVEGSHSYMRPALYVDGAEAKKILELYAQGFFHEIELLRRAMREKPKDV